MPDGDKFYWGVHGTGSRKLLNLVRSGAGLEFAADQGAKVVTEQLKNASVQNVLNGGLEILVGALPRVESDTLAPRKPASMVQRELRNLRSRVGSDDSAAVVHRALENTFERLRSSGRSFTVSEVNREVVGACTAALLGRGVFDGTRSQLMREIGRPAEQQLAYERELASSVAGRTASNFHKVFEKGNGVALRSPRRQSQPRSFTLEELRAPLASQS